EPVAVSAEARITPETGGLWDDGDPRVRPVFGDATCVALGHAGRRGATRPRREGVDRPLAEGEWPLLSASPIPYAPRSQVPREMDRSDMDRVRAEFHRLFLLPFSDLIRNEVGIPAMTSGNITTADQVNTILAAGRADLCVLDPRVLGERTQDVSPKNS